MNNLTMTFSPLSATLTPSWIDCFATDDGRIVVVGGSFQLLVYNIASGTWGDTTTPATTLNYGPSVISGMFTNPVYIQSRILADGYTALVVCTLTWNSQPQPYYLDTNTWSITLAIGTALTTPPSSSSSSSGWGSVPGGGPLLPPAGFRHYSLAIMGQDKTKANKHYGNGKAYIVGGYSTLVTGLVQDWDAITSFPVQQAPSNVVVMFGNAGSLAKQTRGSVAYAVSPSVLDVLPGNGGGTSTQQSVEVFDLNQNKVTMLSGISGGPRNTIFRGATIIGQGSQIFVHGGLTTLEFNSSLASPPTDYLDSSIGVWNGDSQQWGDTVKTFVPKKSKALMIGLIVGLLVLVALIAGGFWFYKRRQRQKRLEEEERVAKGMVLKNEDMLQKEHRAGYSAHIESHNNNNNSGLASTSPTIAFSERSSYIKPDTGNYTPLQRSSQGYIDSSYAYAQAELIDDDSAAHPLEMSTTASSSSSPRRVGNNPQEYHDTMPRSIADSDGLISRSPSHYQTVVNVAGNPIYGMPSGILKHELRDREPVPTLPETLVPRIDGLHMNHHEVARLRSSLEDPSRMLLNSQASSSSLGLSSAQSSQSLASPSSADIRPALYPTSGFSAHSNTSASSGATLALPHGGGGSYFGAAAASLLAPNPYLSSPTFSEAYSISTPGSPHGSDSARQPLIYPTSAAAANTARDSLSIESPPAIPEHTRPKF
ncbi:hypothetical protein BGZ99_003930 [Dissophora globulifera]|uniref:Uncharacterized protein n=1 Tax=Dissophora globulifera TaxID=979702 RepID=A0A9P6UUG8_9FUNG|nr:hypothetical protein BGZ99_003930 [Dissophora globulifera]